VGVGSVGRDSSGPLGSDGVGRGSSQKLFPGDLGSRFWGKSFFDKTLLGPPALARDSSGPLGSDGVGRGSSQKLFPGDFGSRFWGSSRGKKISLTSRRPGLRRRDARQGLLRGRRHVGCRACKAKKAREAGDLGGLREYLSVYLAKKPFRSAWGAAPGSGAGWRGGRGEAPALIVLGLQEEIARFVETLDEVVRLFGGAVGNPLHEVLLVQTEEVIREGLNRHKVFEKEFLEQHIVVAGQLQLLQRQRAEQNRRRRVRRRGPRAATCSVQGDLQLRVSEAGTGGEALSWERVGFGLALPACAEFGGCRHSFGAFEIPELWAAGHCLREGTRMDELCVTKSNFRDPKFSSVAVPRVPPALPPVGREGFCHKTFS
jgi:hypothetical protein